MSKSFILFRSVRRNTWCNYLPLRSASVVPNNRENHHAHVKHTSVTILKAATQAKLPTTYLLNKFINLISLFP